jgi:hypothetical protein
VYTHLSIEAKTLEIPLSCLPVLSCLVLSRIIREPLNPPSKADAFSVGFVLTNPTMKMHQAGGLRLRFPPAWCVSLRGEPARNASAF